MNLSLLNTIGVAGLVWCVSLFLIQKNDLPEMKPEDIVDDFLFTAKVSRIPAYWRKRPMV